MCLFVCLPEGVFMLLDDFGGRKQACCGCTQMVLDRATYLFVHLNVEPIGHLIVL